MKNKICKRAYKELAVAADRKGGAIFSHCCYMDSHAWFNASSIKNALFSREAVRIRENAINNRYGYCSPDCPNWESADNIAVPDVSVERLEMSVSTRCNARCTFCFQAAYDLSLPASIIDEWRKDYLPFVKKFVFGGGEPLLVSFDLIKEVAIKRPDAEISLVTNGILLDKIIPFQSHISGINISLNAGSREVYKRTMKVDAFEKVVGNIRRLRESGYDKPISSTYVICRENCRDIENFLNICKEANITKAGFNVDKTDPYFHVDPSLADVIKKQAQDVGVKVSIGRFDIPLSFAGKLKQHMLYHIRYKQRRKHGNNRYDSNAG